MPSYPFTPIVKDLPSSVPFVGPEAQERGRNRLFKARIGANESVFGPSPRAVLAMQDAAHDAWKYCDPENHDLKQALAAHYDISPENFVIGEGIDGLFGTTARLFIEKGVPVATSLGAYPTFNFQINGCGGAIKTVPFTNDHEDPDALIDLANKEKARLIYLSNPDNPMGTWWCASVISSMIERIPDGSILCLDEAYGEFAPVGTLPAFDLDNPKILRFRTFSKAYGLAGCRIAYAIGEKSLIKSFDKIRNHFGVNRIAQAGALAALHDEAHLSCVIANVAQARDEISSIAGSNGLSTVASAANFVAIDCGRDGDFARRVLANLIERDVFVRMPGVAPLDRCIRVSAGTPEDLAIFATALPEALAAADAGA